MYDALRRRRSLLALVSTISAMSLLLSSCFLGTAAGPIRKGDLAGPVADVKPLDGLDISIGSKNFSENIILGKMAVTLLASAGADVTDLTNIPGSAAARQAQLEGQIDAMWEYTGTGWITYLGHTKPIPDEQKQYVAVRDEDLKTNDLVWLPPAPMNNTYGFAITQAVSKRFGITKLSEIKDVPVKDRTFCVESEFTNRPDGLPGMLKTYGIPQGQANGVPEKNLKTYQTGAVYSATAKGECNFGEVFTTDGRIVALDLTVLKDDKEYFPKYNVSLVVDDDLLKEYPQIEKLFAPITEKLTNEVLLKLNAKVDVDGQEPVDVAYDWLKDEGFIK
ncbi:glycine betaine ABC transporter substrate-binding protein [Nocardioides sp. Root140]|uniref:glycine betaine ABC transporter substrate-binding protein n=1 Tax=Nocardioides sp. Root140 TaxID=1736460 RepID=UPI000700F31F|nr:glycine betaine ABC transporter substrate-binding protein [Nocardioides sp. Root140]KQY62496.1 glycine/betaine ABC transporter substrate-binding protein [Nocardioides sp. Root140]